MFAARAEVVRALNKETERCAAKGSALALILVELDHYDTLVHSAGQESAEQVFDALLRAVKVHCGRDHDRVFRLSAECIAAVCPETFPSGVQHVATRIREAAEQTPTGQGDSTMSISIGFAVTAPDSSDPAEALLARAERCLQSARDKGGNTVVGAATPAPPAPPPTLKSLFRKVPLPATASRRRGD